MEPLRFDPEPGTTKEYEIRIEGVKFYESSLSSEITNEPLLSVVTRKSGIGQRLTLEQVSQLHDYLGDWLDGHYGN